MTDREHIEQLATELDVTIEHTWPDGLPVETFMEAADRANSVVYLGPLLDAMEDAAYFGALHELGHIAAPQLSEPGLPKFMVPPEDILHDEAQATWWAFDQVPEHRFTLGVREAIGGNLGSYFRGQGVFPDGPGADIVRELFSVLGELELPWPKTNAAFQVGRRIYA